MPKSCKKTALFLFLVVLTTGFLFFPRILCAVTPQVAAGDGFTVGLKTDGTVVALGGNYFGQCDVGSWSGIQQVAAGRDHTIGLKTDGTVVAVGSNHDAQCDVDSWTGIQQVAAGWDHTIGLKTDGTVVAVGSNHDAQCDVDSWTGIQQVAAGWNNTVALKTDGTVICVGKLSSRQYDADDSWTGIQQVACGSNHTLGLKTDGTVVAVGSNHDGQCNVASWSGIQQVAAGRYYTIGLKMDGTVVAVGYNIYGQCDVDSWTDIQQVADAYEHTVGLKIDGTVVAVNDNNVDHWYLTDFDGDGLSDYDDNCPCTYNAEQEDSDGDGCGDACDGRPEDPNWASVHGSITYWGNPLCTMVLANGQYMFTCGDDLGLYDLDVPLDQNGEITLYGFCSRMAPFRAILTPAQALCYDITMVSVSAALSQMAITVQTEPGTTNPDWVRITGTVRFDGVPLCAMILINGQNMFSCGADLGTFDLEVPLDGNGEITLSVFCSGFAPYKDVFVP